MTTRFRWETEFKETEIGEIPRDWEVENFCWAVKNLESGNRPKGGILKHDSTGILSIGGENITWQGDLVLEDCLRFSEEFYKSLRRGKIEKEDILLVKDGATIGKLAFIKEIPEGKAMVNEHVFLIKTDREKYNPRYLFYYLFSEIGQSFIENSISGSAQGGINKGILDTVKIPKLNLPEQNRIATVLSWFDDLIENKKRQNEILEKTAMAIFKNWFIDFEPFKDGEFVDSEIGKIPKGWEVKKLGNLGNFYDHKRIPLSEIDRNKREGSYPYYGANGVIDYIDDYIFDGRYLLIPEDGIIGDKYGYTICFLVEEKFWANNHIHVIQGEKVPTEFLYLSLRQTQIEPYITGAVQPKLSQKNLATIQVIYPPFTILQKFNFLVEPLFQKIILNQKQIMLLRKIRDKLLPLLVFGKLRVDDI